MPARVVETKKCVDVEDPRSDDRRVARPGLDPVAPSHGETREVAELVTRVGVEATVTVGNTPC